MKRFEGGRFNVERTFELVGTLLQDSGSPALRTALYQMVSQLPESGCSAGEPNAPGRPGIAVALAGADGTRSELLFDPVSTDVLEEAQVHVRAGTVLHYFAYESRGVVDSVRAVPR